MKKLIVLFATLIAITAVLFGCNSNVTTDENIGASSASESYAGTQIELSDSGIKADGKAVSADASNAVYTANDIVYYESGHDFTYGEGSDADAHSKQEAAAHTVVHITQPGTYVLSGKLSKGQIAVDLGDGAEENPDAVVTLVLNNVDITCEIAPAIIFYNVYECGSKDAETATNSVDTSAAGANVIIADNSENNITGSYVARIYKPDSVILNDDGTEVEDAKKLHKYDGAFYSKMSMNINGGKLGNGVLNIKAANEGLDSELHLTINGGTVNITSGNDGINTNEDYVSVTTVNAGNVSILVNGKTGEGDGIDSNGWLVINGGSVTAQACSLSGDAGIDSDMGIHINGGKVFATGNMLDRISDSAQTFAVFTFEDAQENGVYTLKNSENKTVSEKEIINRFSYLILSDSQLTEGNYTLWKDGTQLQGIAAEAGGGKGGFNPMKTPPDSAPEMPEGMTHPDFGEMPEGAVPPEMPEGMTPPEMPNGMTPPEKPEGMQMPERKEPNEKFESNEAGEFSNVFAIKDGENNFMAVKTVE